MERDPAQTTDVEAQHAESVAAVWFEGTVRINPAEIYMSGKRPATILIHCTTDEARMIDGKRAMLVFDPAQFEERTDG